MKVKYLKYILFLPIMMLAFSCSSDSDDEDDKTEPLPTPVVTLEKDTITISNDGGNAEIRYKIENLIEGETISLKDVPEWITDINTQEFGIITFNVKENDETSVREAQISVDYKDAKEKARFTVRQDAADPRPFTIKTAEITELSINYEVEPLDKDITYLVFCEDASFAEFNDEELSKGDMNYLMQMADYYSQTIEDYLRDNSFTGDSKFTKDNLTPGTGYMIYAYGIDIKTQKRTTEIERLMVSTQNVEMLDVNFSINSKVENSKLYLDVDPQGYTGKYFSSILKLRNKDFVETATHEQVLKEVSMIWMSTRALYLDMGMTIDDMIADSCISGPSSQTFDLEDDALYLLVTVAVNDKALLCSECVYSFVNSTGIIKK